MYLQVVQERRIQITAQRAGSFVTPLSHHPLVASLSDSSLYR